MLLKAIPENNVYAVKVACCKFGKDKRQVGEGAERREEGEMSRLYILECHRNKEETWIWERMRIGTWRQRENGEHEGDEKERIKDGQLVVKEMNRRGTVFSY